MPANPISSTILLSDNSNDNLEAKSDNVYSAVNYDKKLTTRATFALNKKKHMNNLKKDAVIEDYQVTFNNFNENVNIKCSSGFFLAVANPALLVLAKESFDVSRINNMDIQCMNNRISLDICDLQINNVYFFNIVDPTDKVIIANVTIHCHITTKLIQLQGSKVIGGEKAPVWFFHNILKETFKKESENRKDQIVNVNKIIINNRSKTVSNGECNLCEKTYKTEVGLQKHKSAKHKSDKPLSDKKRTVTEVGEDSDEDYSPPQKTVALGTPPQKCLRSSSNENSFPSLCNLNKSPGDPPFIDPGGNTGNKSGSENNLLRITYQPFEEEIGYIDKTNDLQKHDGENHEADVTDVLASQLESCSLNAGAETFKPKKTTIDILNPFSDPANIASKQKFPSNSKRQKSSNINSQNPESEFLMTALNSCKSTIAQQEIEIKRLKESLELRNMRIMNLEEQLSSAVKYHAARPNLNEENVSDIVKVDEPRRDVERKSSEEPGHNGANTSSEHSNSDTTNCNCVDKVSEIEQRLSLLSFKMDNVILAQRPQPVNININNPPASVTIPSSTVEEKSEDSLPVKLSRRQSRNNKKKLKKEIMKEIDDDFMSLPEHEVNNLDDQTNY